MSVTSTEQCFVLAIGKKNKINKKNKISCTAVIAIHIYLDLGVKQSLSTAHC